MAPGDAARSGVARSRRRAGEDAATDLELRPSRSDDLAFITALERHPDNRDLIGQWSDAEHLSAIARGNGREHWIIERDGRPAGYLIAYDCRAGEAGFYVKRILVADKERGTGSAALRRFVEMAAARPGVGCVWLIVRDNNDRAQAVYRKLGFERFEPAGEERERHDRLAEPPQERSFRMRLVL
jgi:ribosomal protein S18 acetylase RimI-like enzyme